MIVPFYLFIVKNLKNASLIYYNLLKLSTFLFCRAGGLEALNEELELELSRISARNLGRDDRSVLQWSWSIHVSIQVTGL